MKINPNFSGGEVAKQLISHACTLDIRKPVLTVCLRNVKVVLFRSTGVEIFRRRLRTQLTMTLTEFLIFVSRLTDLHQKQNLLLIIQK